MDSWVLTTKIPTVLTKNPSFFPKIPTFSTNNHSSQADSWSATFENPNSLNQNSHFFPQKELLPMDSWVLTPKIPTFLTQIPSFFLKIPSFCSKNHSIHHTTSIMGSWHHQALKSLWDPKTTSPNGIVGPSGPEIPLGPPTPSTTTIDTNRRP